MIFFILFQIKYFEKIIVLCLHLGQRVIGGLITSTSPTYLKAKKQRGLCLYLAHSEGKSPFTSALIE
jgi:hypothetical protein